MQNRQPNVKFRFYATLLDVFTDYLNSDIIYEKYWGWARIRPILSKSSDRNNSNLSLTASTVCHSTAKRQTKELRSMSLLIV